jgi:hypothetical protein
VVVAQPFVDSIIRAETREGTADARLHLVQLKEEVFKLIETVACLGDAC